MKLDRVLYCRTGSMVIDFLAVEGAGKLVNDLLLHHKCSQENLFVFEN